jgi:hypothetical protein
MAKSKKKKPPTAAVQLPPQAHPVAEERPRTASDYLIAFGFILFAGALSLFMLDSLIDTAKTGAMCSRKSCTYWSESPFNLGLAFVMLSTIALTLGASALRALTMVLTPE